MKRILGLMLALVMILGLSACGGDEKAETSTSPSAAETASAAATSEAEAEPEDSTSDRPVIGMAMIDLTNAGLIAIATGADAAAEDYNCELIWKACEGNLDNQIDIIRGFIQQGVDAIMIDSLDVDGILPVVNEATDAGVLVFTMGSKVEGTANYNTIYPDYRDAYFAAQTIGKMYEGQEGTVGLIVAQSGNLVSEFRQNGFQDGIAEFDNLTLVTEQGQWDAQVSMQKAEDIIRSNDDLLHIHVIQDGMGYGVQRAIEASGKDIPMSSNDGDLDALALMEDGKIMMENLVGNERLGYWNIVVAQMAIRGESIARDQYLPTYKVMSDELKALVEENEINISADGEEMEIITIDKAKEISSGYADEFGPDSDFEPNR